LVTRGATPATTAAGVVASSDLEKIGRFRPRHSRLQRGDPARSGRWQSLLQPRRRLGPQGRPRPRHSRVLRGDRAQSGIRPRLLGPWRRIGDQARSARGIGWLQNVLWTCSIRPKGFRRLWSAYC